jgi:hypothetical protein
MMGGSGVLAAVSAGLYVSWNGPRLISASTRLHSFFFWGLVVYPVEALLFLVVQRSGDLERQLITAERERVQKHHHAGALSDESRRQIERELNLEEARVVQAGRKLRDVS